MSLSRFQDVLSRQVRRLGRHESLLTEAAPVPSESPAGRYLLVVWGDVDPFLKGPYETDAERVRVAREMRASSDEDGLFRLDVRGSVSVDAFLGTEIDEGLAV